MLYDILKQCSTTYNVNLHTLLDKIIKIPIISKEELNEKWIKKNSESFYDLRLGIHLNRL